MHEAWARAVLEAVGIGPDQRHDEQAVAIGGKRIDAVVDFCKVAPSELLGRFAPLLAQRVVGFEFLSRGMNIRAWLDGLIKTALLYLHHAEGTPRRVAVVNVCVKTSQRFVEALDRWMKRGPWSRGSWHLGIFDDIDYWVVDTEYLPTREAASVWRMFTRLARLEFRGLSSRG